MRPARLHSGHRATHSESSERRQTFMANTKSMTDKSERKAVKRAARKKAAPKAPRTGARGENKAKIKKATRGQSKR